MVEMTYRRGISKELVDRCLTYPIGMNALVREPKYIDVLVELSNEVFPYMETIFKSKFIVNSFSVLNNQERFFAHEIHRDQKFFSGDVPLMYNIIVFLDDFTERNGATLFYPFMTPRRPSSEDFLWECFQATGQSGEVFIFNSNLWHRAGLNKTGKPRRCIAITLTKSCMKQLLDLPRALGDIDYPDNIKQLLGYHSIVPASLEEWDGERTYHKDQD